METRQAETERPRDAAWWGMSAAGVALIGWLAWRAAARAAERNTGDFVHFYEAARAAAHGADIYASGTGGYIYPPLLAALASPLARLTEVQGAWVWLAMNVALTAGAMLIALRFALREVAGACAFRPAPAVALLALALSFEQLRWELELGQTDSVLLFAFAFAMAFSRTRPVATGVLLGLAANVKYLTLIALPYLLIRRRFRAALATVAASIGWALVPALVLGWKTNLGYLERAVRGLAGSAGVAERAADAAAPNTIVWHRSVSVTSAAARVAEALGLGTGVGLAVAGAIALGVLALAWRMYERRGWDLIAGARDEERPLTPAAGAGGTRSGYLDALEWIGLIAAVLAFGPQTTTRHMYLMLLPHVVVAALLVAPPRGVDRRWVVAGVAMFQLGTRLPPGGAGMDGAVEAWRWIGGAGWCVLGMFLMVLWGALGKRGEEESHS